MLKVLFWRTCTALQVMAAVVLRGNNIGLCKQRINATNSWKIMRTSKHSVWCSKCNSIGVLYASFVPLTSSPSWAFISSRSCNTEPYDVPNNHRLSYSIPLLRRYAKQHLKLCKPWRLVLEAHARLAHTHDRMFRWTPHYLDLSVSALLYAKKKMKISRNAYFATLLYYCGAVWYV